MKQKSLKELKILGVKVSSITKSEVLSFVTDRLEKRSKFFITTPNPEIIVAAQSDSTLRTALNSADLALPDGVGLSLAANLRQRIPGRDMFEELLHLANANKLKVYLLGASSGVNKAAIAKIKKVYPNIEVDGTADIEVDKEEYFVTDGDTKKYIVILNHINKFRPDLLFVALGAPKQEKWIFHNLPSLKVGGAMVVGGALDYFVGKVAKPPGWLSGVGLEWLWRAILEPQRIKRIFNAVVIFPLLVVRFKIRSKYLGGHY